MANRYKIKQIPIGIIEKVMKTELLKQPKS